MSEERRVRILSIKPELFADLLKSGQKHLVISGYPLPDDVRVVYVQFMTESIETLPETNNEEIWLYLESEWFGAIDEGVDVPFLERVPEINLLSKWEDYYAE